MARLLDKYKKEIIARLTEQFKYSNQMAVPKLTKIVVSVGLGKIGKEEKVVEEILGGLTAITGQKPVMRRARKSIAGFNLRTNDLVGAFVTLRGQRMYEFLDRLVSFALPRVRDFRGLPKTGFDRAGNYSFGLNEQTIFPEIDFNKVTKVFGMNINLVTSARNRQEAEPLLTMLGLPLEKEE
ncbi:MAG TPA: 50S ribosomal protein L5 [bacterium]|uniref:Large ribosomal subunit protein uL5 n=1 Tax=candidate division TA06 bacterium ADurb.Bin417 TaxID=1852828 RepID=A0A1V5MHN9_UNCT6|nr:MAG: 50S ribosomal protein L5 [candidate division TA06 bacterium ADurb.Bin417]HNQ35343.1 50S ribosomal protein L5 [bacterium]HNS49286.1 50S ribosomal protein L5 [bacterium]